MKVDRVAVGTPGAQVSLRNPQVAFLLNSDIGGGLHALRLETGEEVWHTPHPGCNITCPDAAQRNQRGLAPGRDVAALIPGWSEEVRLPRRAD
jgi:hypothetical protein